MPLIDTPVAELEYLEDGDPAGTPVVLVHGFPDIPATCGNPDCVRPQGGRGGDRTGNL